MTEEFSVRSRRSALYLPASNARAIDKARGLPCDVVILDLEDAVAPDAKDSARRQAVEAICHGGFGERELVVRINALDTDWARDDLAALSGAAPDAILAPKVNDAAEVMTYLSLIIPTVPLWAMIETAESMFHLHEIAGAGPRLGCLIVGTNDLAKDLRARPGPDRATLLPFLAQSVAAARAAGIAILDGVFNTLDDSDGLARECHQAVALGFDGKTLIHPAQIALCNAAFSPTADEIDWSRTVIEAFADPANAGRGAIRLDGRMVERLHLVDARRTVAVADRLGL